MNKYKTLKFIFKFQKIFLVELIKRQVILTQIIIKL